MWSLSILVGHPIILAILNDSCLEQDWHSRLAEGKTDDKIGNPLLYTRRNKPGAVLSVGSGSSADRRIRVAGPAIYH
jgi:hypothetical protein